MTTIIGLFVAGVVVVSIAIRLPLMIRQFQEVRDRWDDDTFWDDDYRRDL